MFNKTELKKHSPYFSYLCCSAVKPRAPTIISVDESNGNFGLKWKTNLENKPSLIPEVDANVTYYKKGDTKKVVCVPGNTELIVSMSNCAEPFFFHRYLNMLNQLRLMDSDTMKYLVKTWSQAPRM